MSQNCPKCQTANPQTARFCQACGTTLSATMVQERTVVAQTVPPGPPQMSPAQVQTIVQRAQKTFGAGPVAVMPNHETQVMSNQREHAVLTTDVSDSMNEIYDGQIIKVEAAKRADISMILNKAQIDPYDEIGIVSFNSKAQQILSICPIHSHKSQIIQAVQSLKAYDGTDINEGLKVARDMFDWNRNDIVRRIVLLTDGHGGHPLRTADDLKSRGAVIDVIGIGDKPSNVNEKLLRKVASVIEGELRYRFIKDQQTLVAHYTQLANKTATC
ncbi:VWA domain-containing protein [Planctomycetota bacterium]